MENGEYEGFQRICDRRLKDGHQKFSEVSW